MSKLSWTPEEDEALRKAVAEGVGLQRLSVRFKRPVTGIKNRLKALDLQVKKPQRLKYADRILDATPSRR